VRSNLEIQLKCEILDMKRVNKGKDIKETYTHENCYISELMNTKDYDRFSVARARVSVGMTTELHTLRNTDEVYVVISGKGQMEINHEDVGTVEPGDLVFIPANEPQKIKNIGEVDLVFLCICSPRFEQKNYDT
jgi:mannose-6-phosphate isomerase-like protein (cupin superfamily)